MTALPTRPLGRTEMQLTRVGFGAWAVGGAEWAFGWGEQDDRDSIAAIRHAVARGVNWIDTAAAYGLGHSEEVVARALGDVPAGERPYVFTKCGLRWDDADRARPPARAATRESVKRECEGSLRRLGVETIDLYQVHWPPSDGTPVEEYWQGLLDLQREGKVRHVGLSNHSVEQLARAERLGHVESLQPPFSAVRRTSAPELAWCHAHGTGVIFYSPMQSGLLTDRFTEERTRSFPEDDWRRRSPDFLPPKLGRNLALRDGLRPIADRHGTTVSSVAIAWTLMWSGVTGAIVGGRTPAQVDGWLDAATLELTGEDLAEVAAAIERTGAGEGPVRA